MFKRSVKNSVETTLRDDDYARRSPYEQNLKTGRKVRDPHLGDVMLSVDPATNAQIVMRERKFHSKTDAARALAAVRRRLATQSPFSVRLLDYSADKQSQMCATVYTLRQFWQAPSQDIRREALARQGQNRPFTEPELAFVLFRLAKADAAGTHGDLNPLNVDYDRATGAALLMDYADEPPSAQRTLAAQKARLASKQSLYQSPAMYAGLRASKPRTDFDMAKESAFALGLVLLELGNLRPIGDIYNEARREVDLPTLAQHVGAFRARYGNGPLTAAVERLLHPDEQQRLSIGELAASLPEEAQFQGQLGAVQSRVLGGSFMLNSGMQRAPSPPTLMHEYFTNGAVMSPRTIANYEGPDAGLARTQYHVRQSSVGPARPREMCVAAAPVFGEMRSNSAAPQPMRSTGCVSYIQPVHPAEGRAGMYPQQTYQYPFPGAAETAASVVHQGELRLVRTYQDPVYATEVRNY